MKSGEVVLLLGRNGAGKTTLLNTVAGLLPLRSGHIVVKQRDVSNFDEHGRIACGIRIALEGRQVFSRLTVMRNLLIGAYTQKQKQAIHDDIDWVLDVFPDLVAKLNEPAGSLSGGQQTMLNIGRALMGKPKLLLMDEPTLGLSPTNVNKLIRALEQIRRQRDVSILVAEQSGPFARAFSDRIILLIGGEITYDGSWQEAYAEGRLSEVLA